jgi:uncharacterized protein (TIGR03437 family)
LGQVGGFPEQGLILLQGGGPITAAILITGTQLSSQVTFAPPPAISLVANAFRDSSVYGPATPVIAPNTWVEITGSNLAPDSRPWQSSDFANGQMPMQLDGVSVTVNGKNAYVYYISPTQVNVLTPPDAIPSGAQVQLNNGISGYTTSVMAYSLSPSFFVFNGGPYVTATHLNGSYIGPVNLYPGLSSPAQAGETIVLYANGFGPTSTSVVSGSVTQSGSLAALPTIQIGGVPATVLSASLVAPGEYQFNVVVPTNAASGDQPIVASVYDNLYRTLSTQPGALLTIQ